MGEARRTSSSQSPWLLALCLVLRAVSESMEFQRGRAGSVSAEVLTRLLTESSIWWSEVSPVRAVQGSVYDNKVETVLPVGSAPYCGCRGGAVLVWCLSKFRHWRTECIMASRYPRYRVDCFRNLRPDPVHSGR